MAAREDIIRLESYYERDIGDTASRTIIESNPLDVIREGSGRTDIVAASPFTRGNDPIRDAIIEQKQIDNLEKPKPLPIKRGCLDPFAENYDRTATVNDPSSCEYPSTNNVSTGGDTIKPLSESLNVQIQFLADAKDVELLEGGKETKKYIPTLLQYTAKELLIPKSFTARKTGLKSPDVFRVYSRLRKERVKIKPTPFTDFVPTNLNRIEIGRGIPLGFAPTVPANRPNQDFGEVIYNTYEVIFEKNGSQLPVLKNDVSNLVLLKGEFDLESEIIIPDEPAIGVSIVSDLSKDGDVQVIASWGDKIVLEEDGEERFWCSGDGSLWQQDAVLGFIDIQIEDEEGLPFSCYVTARKLYKPSIYTF